MQRLAAGIVEARWSISFVAVLVYVASAVTYQLPLVGPAVVAAVIGLVMEKERLTIPPFMLFFAGFIAWGAVGYTGSWLPSETSKQMGDLLKIALIVFAMTNVVRTAWRARIFAIFFLGCFGLYPVRGTLFNYFITGYTRFGRALWNFIYENSNDLAALTFLPLSLCVALALTEKKGWIRTAALVGCGVLPLMILLTQSRGALIALVVAIILFFILHSNGKRARTLLTAAALAVLTLPFVPESAWQRFGGLADVSEGNFAEADPEGSAEARYIIWGIAKNIAVDYPITGVGLGAYPMAHARYAEPMTITRAAKGPRDTHSTYLNIAAELGFVGLVLFLAMIATVFIEAEVIRRRAKHIPRSQQILALQLGLVAFLLAGLFGSFSRLSFLYVQLAFLWITTNLTKTELAAFSAQSRSGPSGPRLRGGYR